MLESQPNTNFPFPPAASKPYKVKSGQSWASLAEANGLSTWNLIEFNFPVLKKTASFQLKCRQVNWLLRTHVGCTKSTDGKNFSFSSADNPGLIYLPTEKPTITFTHKVRLHFRSLSLTDVPFETLLSRAKSVYAPHGIKMEYASGESLYLTEEQEKKFKQVDGSCKWKITTGEFDELQQLGSPAPKKDIIVYYVESFGKAGLLGCGGHRVNRPACIVAANASQWDTAHEVGHVLLGSAFTPVHHASVNNLMHATSVPASLPTLTAAQVTQMKKSVCCSPV